MRVWLGVGAAAIGAGDAWLAVICWRSRTALGGVAALIGLGLIAFTAATGLAGEAATAATVIALVFLLLGAALAGLGQLLAHLLDSPTDPEDS